MKFNEPEVVELGAACELILETLIPDDEEGPTGARMKNESAIYMDAE